jgi:UrcA family protein
MSRLSLVFAVALMSAAPLFAAPAQAEDAQVRVSIRGVDFADPAAVKAFYERVRAAARATCNSSSLTAWGSSEDEACRSQFVRDAVKQINEPVLTRLDDRVSRGSSSAFVQDDR